MGGNQWRYLLEQQGFGHTVDTTFMITFMFPAGVNEDHIERYFRTMQRAQMDIDLEPERYKHHFLKEIPVRFHDIIDVRRFGPGERIVFLPYTQDMFDKTQSWMHERNLFDVGPEVGVSYEVAVRH
jgi:NitT/TauT family transport system substrate-binding protein